MEKYTVLQPKALEITWNLGVDVQAALTAVSFKYWLRSNLAMRFLVNWMFLFICLLEFDKQKCQAPSNSSSQIVKKSNDIKRHKNTLTLFVRNKLDRVQCDGMLWGRLCGTLSDPPLPLDCVWAAAASVFSANSFRRFNGRVGAVSLCYRLSLSLKHFVWQLKRYSFSAGGNLTPSPRKLHYATLRRSDPLPEICSSPTCLLLVILSPK